MSGVVSAYLLAEVATEACHDARGGQLQQIELLQCDFQKMKMEVASPRAGEEGLRGSVQYTRWAGTASVRRRRSSSTRSSILHNRALVRVACQAASLDCCLQVVLDCTATAVQDFKF